MVIYIHIYIYIYIIYGRTPRTDPPFVVASFEFVFFLVSNMNNELNKVFASPAIAMIPRLNFMQTLDFHCCQLGVPRASWAELG